MNTYKDYLNLLNMNYNKAIKHLQNKYGLPTKDYFIEKPYIDYVERHIDFDINDFTINELTTNYITANDEGLYVHHIADNMYMNITNIKSCRIQNVPFQCHTRENLVYCDIIEHMILHRLIMLESLADEINDGMRGYKFELMPKLVEWFVDDEEPSVDWEIKCKNAIKLNKQEVLDIIKVIQKGVVNNNHYEIEKQLYSIIELARLVKKATDEVECELDLDDVTSKLRKAKVLLEKILNRH